MSMHLGRLLIAPYLHAHPLKATKNKQKRERKRGTQHKFYNKNMVNMPPWAIGVLKKFWFRVAHAWR